jgi:hypothetical protein
MEGTLVQVNISAGGLPKTAIDEGWITPLGIEGGISLPSQSMAFIDRFVCRFFCGKVQSVDNCATSPSGQRKTP